MYRITILESLLGNDRTFQRDDLYLRYCRELRENLKAIGLDERQPEVTDRLKTYIIEREQETRDLSPTLAKSEGGLTSQNSAESSEAASS